MVRIITLSFIFLNLFYNPCFSQIDEEEEYTDSVKTENVFEISKADSIYLKLGLNNFEDKERANKTVRTCFYNVENLFDTEDDPKINDDEFLPTGMKGWSYFRYQQKLNNIYKTMTALGGWGGPPEIIGFCEIENKKVLEDLINKTPFQKYDYNIVHEDSPDGRGIDVGLIYNEDKFQVLYHEKIKVIFPFDTSARTRDILYVCGKVLGKDSLHVFVNHWPSRRGGQAASEPRRIHTAKLVKSKVDSILKSNVNSNILIMGDLNDEAENKSISEILNAKHEISTLKENDLYNFMFKISENWKLGSHKFQGKWGTIDQIIVSSALLKNKKGKLSVQENGAKIFSARFLLEEDKRFMGLQPFRTYAGPKYTGGFSDHLPVYIDLYYSEN